MAILVSDISLPFEEPPELAVEKALERLGRPATVKAYIAKRSVDARKRDNIAFVYTVALELESGKYELVERLRIPGVRLRESKPLILEHGDEKLDSPPVVVGFGPAGMLAGLVLAREGYRPVILERGYDMDSRTAAVQSFWKTGILDINSNVQFGEGGAGTFSDGKLTTRIGDIRTDFVLNELVRHGAPEEILYNAKPHVGTDKLREIVKSIRREIIELGGEIRFRTALSGIKLQAGRIRAVATSAGEIKTSALVLAIGHSARDTFSILLDIGLAAQSKPFSVGLRMEHLQSDIDAALYGRYTGHPLLPKGEYQLSYRRDGDAVYTFCMCPGGVVVPCSSEEDMVVTNGMSEYARDAVNANCALVVSVDSRDFGSEPFSGIRFQQELESRAFRLGGGGYAAPAQTAGLFLQKKSGMQPGRISPSYARGIKEADFSALLPEKICDMLRLGILQFDRKLSGFACADAILTGVESRTSSPVRFLRGENMQAIGMEGIYPCGEGAGYAGGIMSAAVDGMRAAQAIMARYTP